MEIKINSLSYGGAGVGRINGKVVFVEGGVPGDILKINIVRETEKYSRAVIEEFIKESEGRTKPECEFFSNCGGCCWQDVKYEVQLAEKQKIVFDSLSRIGKLTDLEIEEIAASPNEYSYRNRVLLTVFRENDQNKVGFFEEGSKRNIAINRCVIASDEINRVIELLLNYFDEKNNLPVPVERIYISSAKGKVSISFLQAEKSSNTESKEIIQDMVDYLESNLMDIELGHELESDFMDHVFISNAYVFSQANYEINKKIVGTVAGWIENIERKNMLDLFCGTGNFSILLSQYFEHIVGVDSDPDAIKLAERNAGLNDIKNIRFINEKCKNYLSKLDTAPDVLLADPPRTGMKELIVHIERLKPKFLIYISCNPSTLARDLKSLAEMKYKIKRIKPFDMFPHTYHIESAAMLELV